jgi:DNA replication protein DnaC
MDNERIETLLRKLHLRRMREMFQDCIDQSSREGKSFADFLGRLLEEEVAARDERRIARLIRQADFPFIATLEQFDFRRQPELRRQVFQSYLDASFVREGRALVLIGPPGLGKTHLGISVGIHLAQRGFDARCVRVQTLVNRVLSAEGVKGRERVLRPFVKCDVLLLDELGYLAAEEGTGPLLYELIAQRYERRATIITSNKSLTQWGRVLNDTALAGALIDRLMHHGDVYYLKGPSYRLKDKTAPVLDSGEQEQPQSYIASPEPIGNRDVTKYNGKSGVSEPPDEAESAPQNQLSKRNVTKPEGRKDV